MSNEVKVNGEVELPEIGSRWVDNHDDSRCLSVNEVVVGDRLGREVRGQIHRNGDWQIHEGNYATDLNTFSKVWLPLGQPVVQS